MIQRFIITGGPATGKSSIVKYFQQIGHSCFEEVSREIIQEQNIKTSAKKFDFEAVVLSKEKNTVFSRYKTTF